jgi:hypothetical protein
MKLITLSDIVDKWEGLLAVNVAVEQFCQEKYGKSLKILNSANRKRKIEDDDCPVAVIIPLSIDGGPTSSETKFNLLVFSSIANKLILIDDVTTEFKNIVNYGRVNKLPGAKESETLAGLIWDTIAIANPSYPAEKINLDLNSTDHFPQFPCHMFITVTVRNYRSGANPMY